MHWSQLDQGVPGMLVIAIIPVCLYLNSAQVRRGGRRVGRMMGREASLPKHNNHKNKIIVTMI